MDEKDLITSHPYSPEDEPEGEFINCRYCGKPKGYHKFPIPHPDIHPEFYGTTVEGYADGGNDDRGIYPKYVVFKHPKQEVEHFQAKAWIAIPDHENAWDIPTLSLVDDFVFVLKPLKDKHARVAMAAYAESIYDEKPQLARDIWQELSEFHSHGSSV